MIIFPAVDLSDGKAVRLKQGRRHDATIYADDPVAMAAHWAEQGASWLHVIDLDGAFDGKSGNGQIISAICRIPNIRVQLGGGIRDADLAQKYLDSGVSRLIIGTMALENPRLFEKLCRRFPGSIGVSLDAENGRLKSRGWVADAGKTVKEILPFLSDAGANFIIYTDISRDGMGRGVNLPALRELARISPLPVIAAGGVADMRDVMNLHDQIPNLEGVITGRAIYENTLNLAEATAWLAKMDQSPPCC